MTEAGSLEYYLDPSVRHKDRGTGFWDRIRKVKSVGDISKTSNPCLRTTTSIPAFAQHSSGRLSNPPTNSCNKSSWKSKVSRQRITVPHTSKTPIDSAYSSLCVSPEEANQASTEDCPSIPRFSWQSCVKSGNPPRTRPRHVEIIIPSSIAQVTDNTNHTQKQILTPARSPSPDLLISEVVSRFPLPRAQTVMGDRSTSDRPSSGHSRSRAVDSGTATTLGFQAKSSRPIQLNAQTQSTEQQTSFLAIQPAENVTRPTTASSLEAPVAGIDSVASPTTSSLGGLVCDIHRTTGHEPPALVGASTTVVKDKLYVFGGRRLSRRMPQLTRSLYELDLISRHWTKLHNGGSAPIPRYFHSMCALGDSKLVCYGGMAQMPEPTSRSGSQNVEAAMTVMSDVHVYDIASQSWTAIPTAESPPGRYAHCAAILPSSAVFASAKAPLSAMHHNPGSGQPNQGSIGITIDGRGGAEMIIVGGQDSASRYIEQISVFNLRNLKWTTSTPFGRSCGAYRSVVTPLLGVSTKRLGTQSRPNQQYWDSDEDEESSEEDEEEDLTHSGSPMLLYSNYNFLDVKLELQIRLPDGSLIEKQMQGEYSPPGLRFPNGGVIAGHFVISGTFLTSTKQEYALWALNLQTLTWSRVDVGGNIFTTGSWNRGVLWNRRNAYVILGNRKRNLGEDYNHRRLNFSHMCVVEFEAFGLYEDAKCMTHSMAVLPSHLSRPDFRTTLGLKALTLRDINDMEILALNGERIPVNSQLLARRWGSYFQQLLHESDNDQASTIRPDDGSETSTLRPSAMSVLSRSSGSTGTSGTTLVSRSSSDRKLRAGGSTTASSRPAANRHSSVASAPTLPLPRSRLLYLPHTPPTIRALLHYLYTTTLPPPTHPLCTPQILCSLLQLARPYRVHGLLDATISRLHATLDAKTTASVFHAAALACGSGEAVGLGLGGDDSSSNFSTGAGGGIVIGVEMPGLSTAATMKSRIGVLQASHRRGGGGGSGSNSGGGGSGSTSDAAGDSSRAMTPRQTARRPQYTHDDSEDSNGEQSSTSVSSDVESDDVHRGGGGGGSSEARRRRDREREPQHVWRGGVSGVVGLQKRGLRGLMEGRRVQGTSGGGGGASMGAQGDVSPVEEKGEGGV